MRKIKSNFFISLDGVVEAPDQWHFPYFNDQMGEAIGAGAADVGAYLMGRVLYEEWAAYWPEHADEPFGDVLNATKKYVVSDTLTSAEWQNSEIVGGDVATKVGRGQGPGRRRHRHVRQPDDRPLAAPRRPARRAAPVRPPDRGR